MFSTYRFLRLCERRIRFFSSSFYRFYNMIYFVRRIGTIEQLDDDIEEHSTAFRALYHSQRIETAR